MVSKNFKNKGEAGKWITGRVNAMLKKNGYNQALISVGIRKWEDWGASVSVVYDKKSLVLPKGLTVKQLAKLRRRR